MSESVEAVGVYLRDDGDLNLWLMLGPGHDGPTYQLTKEQAAKLVEQIQALIYP